MIPVNEPLLTGREKELLAQCIDTGWISSDGPFVKEFEEKFSEFIGVKYGVAVCNGTAALEAALYGIGIEKGDEIGFTMYDGVEYGINHEYGTIRHWVPFYYYNDVNKPVLAPWGARVLKLSQEEMLAMGGIEVEISESMPFRKALLEIENNAKEIFGKEFKK